MIRSIEIKGLRGIKEGKLDDFTPLVILVGPNGCGKSTVLDALLIGGASSCVEAIVEVVQRRTGIELGVRWLLWQSRADSSAEITVSNEAESRTYLLYKAPNNIASIFCRVSGYTGEDTRITFRPDNVYDSGTVPPRISPLVSGIKLVSHHHTDTRKLFVDLYSEVVIQGGRKEVKAIIGEVVPGLHDITLLTENALPLLSLEFEDRALPVAMAGDGVQTLLRFGLELASRSDGVVLLEEPEVHQHPGAIRQSAKAILAAVRRDIQVIISTHSLELIDALLAEMKDDAELEILSVYGLRLQDGCLKHYRMPGEEVSFSRVQIANDLR
jgi:predicted ATPase